MGGESGAVKGGKAAKEGLRQSRESMAMKETMAEKVEEGKC